MMRKLFGEFLVDEGFIADWQLSAGLRMQERLRKRRLGEILVDLGRLHPDALACVVADQLAQVARGDGQRAEPIGQRLVDEGLVSELDVVYALEIQGGYRDVRIGEVLVELGFMTPEQLDCAIRLKLDELSAA